MRTIACFLFIGVLAGCSGSTDVPKAPAEWFDAKYRIIPATAPQPGMVWVQGKGWVPPGEVPAPGDLTEEVMETHFTHFIATGSPVYSEPEGKGRSGRASAGTKVVAGEEIGDYTLVCRRTQDNRPLNYYILTSALRPRSDGLPPGVTASVEDDSPTKSAAAETPSSPPVWMPKEAAKREIRELGGLVSRGSLGNQVFTNIGFYRKDFSAADPEKLKRLPQLIEAVVEPETMLRLDLRSVTGTGRLLEALRGLTDVFKLDLSQSDVSDADLQHVAAIDGLRQLDLGRTQITAAGVKHLTGLTKLEFLSLYLCQNVTDAAIPHLEAMKSLDDLSVRSSGVSQSGAERLRKALPETKVEW